VITIGVDGRHPDGAGQFGNLFACPAVAHDQAAAPGLQRGVEFAQRFMDEMHAPVTLRRQRIKDLAVEDEGAMDLARFGQGRAQGRMVVVAQVATEPDESFFVFHGWFVLRRRLEFPA